jgi:hypothetical protein
LIDGGRDARSPRGGSERPQELAELVGQQLRLFEGGEVPASRHAGPAGDVAAVFGELTRRACAPWTVAVGEDGEPGRHLDPRSGRGLRETVELPFAFAPVEPVSPGRQQ